MTKGEAQSSTPFSRPEIRERPSEMLALSQTSAAVGVEMTRIPTSGPAARASAAIGASDAAGSSVAAATRSSRRRPRRPYVSPEALAALERAVPSVAGDLRCIVPGASTPSPLSIRAGLSATGVAIPTVSATGQKPGAISPFSSEKKLRKQQVLDLIRRYATPTGTNSSAIEKEDAERGSSSSVKKRTNRGAKARADVTAAHTPPLSQFRVATAARSRMMAAQSFMSSPLPRLPLHGNVAFETAQAPSYSNSTSHSSANTTVGPSPVHTAFGSGNLFQHKPSPTPVVDLGTALVIAEAKRLKEYVASFLRGLPF